MHHHRSESLLDCSSVENHFLPIICMSCHSIWGKWRWAQTSHKRPFTQCYNMMSLCHWSVSYSPLASRALDLVFELVSHIAPEPGSQSTKTTSTLLETVSGVLIHAFCLTFDGLVNTCFWFPVCGLNNPRCADLVSAPAHICLSLPVCGLSVPTHLSVFTTDSDNFVTLNTPIYPPPPNKSSLQTKLRLY